MSRPKHKDIATAIGLIGMLSATALVVFGDTHDLDSKWISPIGVIFLAGPRAWVAGLIFGGLFGLPGPWGWATLALGAVLSTFLGAAIAGTFVVPLLGTMIAPFELFEQMIQHPMMLVVWLGLMAGVHVLILKSESYGTGDA